MDIIRSLWVAVVLQARDDLASEKLGSIIYNQAVAFFFHGGEWERSRREIGDFLELHPDDLTRLGRETLAGREDAGAAVAGMMRPVKKAPCQPTLVQERRDRQWWVQRFLAGQQLQ